MKPYDFSRNFLYQSFWSQVNWLIWFCTPKQKPTQHPFILNPQSPQNTLKTQKGTHQSTQPRQSDWDQAHLHTKRSTTFCAQAFEFRRCRCSGCRLYWPAERVSTPRGDWPWGISRTWAGRDRAPARHTASPTPWWHRRPAARNTATLTRATPSATKNEPIKPNPTKKNHQNFEGKKADLPGQRRWWNKLPNWRRWSPWWLLPLFFSLLYVLLLRRVCFRFRASRRCSGCPITSRMSHRVLMMTITTTTAWSPASANKQVSDQLN